MNPLAWLAWLVSQRVRDLREDLRLEKATCRQHARNWGRALGDLRRLGAELNRLERERDAANAALLRAEEELARLKRVTGWEEVAGRG